MYIIGNMYNKVESTLATKFILRVSFLLITGLNDYGAL